MAEAGAPAGRAGLGREINGLLRELLPAGLPKVRAKTRYLHDSVWGTIEVFPHEISLINSPLLQRLRRIRQLGGAHLVFPGAVHTRFEHTVGVVLLVELMCNGLNKPGEERVTDGQRLNLRMAAICHDAGHGPFSHNSEFFFRNMEPRGTSAEDLSAGIVCSEAFRKFIDEVNGHFKDGSLNGSALDCDFIARAIQGRLPRDMKYLGEIVHGPFDADKLDYLSRDGMHCGIPIHVDAGRIYRLMKVRDVEGEMRLVGGRRAIAALAQLVNHKLHMNTVVYHHDVSRACKVMCVNAFECVVEDGATINGNEIASPASFLALDDEMALVPGAVRGSDSAASIFCDMRNRRLFKVAARFDRNKVAAGDVDGSDTDKLRVQIAEKAKVPRHLVAVDLAPATDNKEAKNMLVEDESQITLKLLELMDLKDRGSKVSDHLIKDTVFCHGDHVEQVRKAAVSVLSLSG